MNKLQSFCLFLIGFGIVPLMAQSNTQTVRGTVKEMGTDYPLSGVNIRCIVGEKILSTFSDSTGYFRLDSVPIGRQNFFFSKPGYTDRTVNFIDVIAGKELVLQILLEENITSIAEVKIKANKDPKENPINALATVSARQFSVEETQRFAAAVNDPARMAMSFAGVMAPDDGNNSIVIRGNAPNGLIWRMEGMDIPNPNHFSNVGTSGGGITILSAQVLHNSDFITGAFPAEYGNGLSGVFDLRLRKGNNERREHTVQFGLLGLDLATEGPLGKKGGSYLVNYRYSTLSMISALGIELGDAVTKFQDLSYHIQVPVTSKIRVSLFGFTGLSNQKSDATLDTLIWKTIPDKAYEWKFTANSMFNGCKIEWHPGRKHSIELKAGLGLTQHGYAEKKYDNELNGKVKSNIHYLQTKITLSALSNYKINKRMLLRSGAILNRQGFNFYDDELNQAGNLQNYLSVNGATPLLQVFSQLQYKPSVRWTLNGGIHTMYLALNQSHSVEPRFGARFQAGRKSWFSAGYGRHSQIQPLGTYFYKADGGAYPNNNLKLSQAHHLIMGYDRMLSKYWHVKTELYCQWLFHIPVSPDPASTYSILNSMEGFDFENLVSTGKGKNYGAEVTLEKFFSGSTYVLLTGSVSDSRYTDGQGRTYSTRFNVGHTLSFLAGKEWTMGRNRLGFNIKTLWLGGMHDHPINIEASQAAKTTIRDYSKTYAWQNPDYFRIDTKISYKINRKKHSVTWSLDLQNTTNHTNVWGSYYNPETGKIAYSTQAPLIPILAYKVEF